MENLLAWAAITAALVTYLIVGCRLFACIEADLMRDMSRRHGVEYGLEAAAYTRKYYYLVHLPVVLLWPLYWALGALGAILDRGPALPSGMFEKDSRTNS